MGQQSWMLRCAELHDLWCCVGHSFRNLAKVASDLKKRMRKITKQEIIRRTYVISRLLIWQLIFLLCNLLFETFKDNISIVRETNEEADSSIWQSYSVIQEWRPMFDQNWSDKRVYQRESRALVRQKWAKGRMHGPGVEPGASAYRAGVLPQLTLSQK